MTRIAVCVSGGGTNLQALIDRIEDGTVTNAVIAVVISSKAGVYALTRAKDAGIATECVSPKEYPDKEAFAEQMLAALERHGVDLVLTAGYLTVFPPAIIEKYAGRIINIHPSLIPAHCGKGYYGLRVHESVLARGNKVTGATVHFADEGTDTGPILLQKAVDVREDDTPETLQRRVMEEAEWVILPQAVNLIANGRVRIEGKLAKVADA